MNRRRADRPSLHERIHGVPPPIEETPQPRPMVEQTIRHCWVTDDNGRLPGLLLEWRRTVSGWQRRAVRPTLETGEWIVVEEWLLAELLDQG